MANVKIIINVQVNDTLHIVRCEGETFDAVVAEAVERIVAIGGRLVRFAAGGDVPRDDVRMPMIVGEAV